MYVGLTGAGSKPKLELNLEVFNFDNTRKWNKVLRVANHTLVLQALDVGMESRCRKLRRCWSREKGPWQCTRHCNSLPPPKSDKVRWYQASGDGIAISPWEAAVGNLLYPDHQWLIACTYLGKLKKKHSAAIGLREKDKSVVIMDVLWYRRFLRKQRERELLHLLLRYPSFVYPFEAAISKLKNREKLRFW